MTKKADIELFEAVRQAGHDELERARRDMIGLPSQLERQTVRMLISLTPKERAILEKRMGVKLPGGQEG